MTRRILITGASRGIGRAIAERLANDGVELVLHYHSNQAAAESVAEACRQKGAECRLVQFDLADGEACRSVLEADIESHGAYYGVVCNAGISDDSAFPAMTEASWDKVLRTNLDGFYHVVHPCVMPMVQARKGGRIVTLSSLSGVAGNRGQVNYSAAKAGIIGATKALALELAKRKITVNCVAPGLIETDMTDDLPQAQLKEMVPVRRFGQPQEVAAAVDFLMSDDASYITRQVLSVNGGML
ncbi:3-ketoacyl-ACP reductase FabG2 [Ferrimonas kyonanensis]|uniref:3-ketoacyl-ACP reductase FabG2 n=1 Tax=Ferrimonas kyonanensis TaxID=364763 RepID=UPI0003F8CA85|nr:3-ketoacyl-ACP reductase FabG2 [Ferrimonas kyonanensis]